MFIKHKEVTVNTENVSNVGFLDSKNRIVFNFSHSIELTRDNTISTIADYKYFDCLDKDEYMDLKKRVQKNLLECGFLKPSVGSHYWVNPTEISYINTDLKKNRLIFNLSTAVTKETPRGFNVINDFVFWTYDSPSELEFSLEKVYERIGV